MSTSNFFDNNDLKIMSWNILSDAPIWKKKYEHMKKEYWIYWDYRKKLIVQHIKNVNPDIFLLCECEYKEVEYFSREFVDNYNYIYASGEPKKSEEKLKSFDLKD